MFDFSSQSSPHANMAIRKLCEELNDCNGYDPTHNINDTVVELRSMDATDLQLLNVKLAYNNIINYPIWQPVKYDGHFFTMDAEVLLKNGHIDDDVSIMWV